MMIVVILGSLVLAQAASDDSVSVRQVVSEEPAPYDGTIDQLSEPGAALLESPDPEVAQAEPAPLVQLSDADTNVEFARVEGIDRCSAELLSASDADYCARRLEARSAEFGNTVRPAYTAEQVLIADRLVASVDGDIATRSRTAGARDANADDRGLQALAAITLAPGVAAEEPLAEGTDSSLPTETQSLIEAIVQRLADPSGGQ